MNGTKRAVLLLLLAAVVGLGPEPTTGHDHCDGLKNKMPLTDLHKLNGEWLLVWAVANGSNGNEMLSILDVSNVEIHYDNTTFLWTEKNTYKSGPKHMNFHINETLHSGPGDAIVHANNLIMEVNGVPKAYNDSGELTFYVSCPDCIRMTYKEKNDHYLVYYVRHGVHRAHKNYSEEAECLGFTHEHPYIHNEECEKLIKPLPANFLPKMQGRTNLLLGQADHEVFKALVKLTESYYGNITASPSNSNEVIITQVESLNGTCITSKINMVFEGDTATSSLPNLTSVHHFLPTCDGCMLALAHTTAANLNEILRAIGVKLANNPGKLEARALYLMTNETTVTPQHLEQFKKTAHCLGFSGEPDFHYNEEKGFCKEGEGITFQ